MSLVLLPLMRHLGWIVEEEDGVIVLQQIAKERSVAEWLRDNLPEGSTFSIESFEVEGEEAKVKVYVRLPYGSTPVDVQINAVPLQPGGSSSST